MCAGPKETPTTGLAARIMLKLLRVYQLTFSALLGRTCRHLPSCSEYTSEAILRFGAGYGFWLGLARIIRCNPWGTQGYDPVPETLPDHGWRVWRYGIWRLK